MRYLTICSNCKPFHRSLGCPLSINAQNFRDVALKEDLQSDGQTFTKLSIVNNIKITIDIL